MYISKKKGKFRVAFNQNNNAPHEALLLQGICESCFTTLYRSSDLDNGINYLMKSFLTISPCLLI